MVVVDCDEDVQIERVMRRSHLSDVEVRRIMASQVGRKERLDAADDVVDNNEGLDDLEPQVERLHRHYLALAQEQARYGD